MDFHLPQPISFRSAVSFQRNLLQSFEKVCRVPVITLARVFITPPHSLCLPMLVVLFVVNPLTSFNFWLRSPQRSWLGDGIFVFLISAMLLGRISGICWGMQKGLIGKYYCGGSSMTVEFSVDGFGPWLGPFEFVVVAPVLFCLYVYMGLWFVIQIWNKILFLPTERIYQKIK